MKRFHLENQWSAFSYNVHRNLYVYCLTTLQKILKRKHFLKHLQDNAY